MLFVANCSGTYKDLSVSNMREGHAVNREMNAVCTASSDLAEGPPLTVRSRLPTSSTNGDGELPGRTCADSAYQTLLLEKLLSVKGMDYIAGCG